MKAFVALLALASEMMLWRPVGSAPEGDRTKVGTLTCKVLAAKAIASDAQLSCMFTRSPSDGADEYYGGRLPAPVAAALAMSPLTWTVWTKGKTLAPGGLEGTFEPASRTAGESGVLISRDVVLRPGAAATGAPASERGIGELMLVRYRPRAG